MTGNRRDDALVVAAALLPLGWLLLRERAIAGAAGFPLDDAWIHLTFARSLAEGHGLAYRPGAPVAGSTAPLWTALLAPLFLLPGSAAAWSKALGAVLFAALGPAAWRLARGWLALVDRKPIDA